MLEFLFPKSCSLLVNGIRAIKNSLVNFIIISYKKTISLLKIYTVFLSVLHKYLSLRSELTIESRFNVMSVFSSERVKATSSLAAFSIL